MIQNYSINEQSVSISTQKFIVYMLFQSEACENYI